MFFVVSYLLTILTGIRAATCWSIGLGEWLCNKHRQELEEDDRYSHEAAEGFDPVSVPDAVCDRCLDKTKEEAVEKKSNKKKKKKANKIRYASYSLIYCYLLPTSCLWF